MKWYTYKEILEEMTDKELIELIKKLDVEFMCDRLGISDVREACNEIAKRFEKYITDTD